MLAFTPRTEPWLEAASRLDGSELLEQWHGPIPSHHLEAISHVVQDDRAKINRWLTQTLPMRTMDMLDYPSVEQFRFSNDVSEAEIFQWLHDRGVPYQTEVFVFLNTQYEQVLVMPWKLLIKYWEAFENMSSYALIVTDRTCQWACLFHHEQYIQFGKY